MGELSEGLDLTPHIRAHIDGEGPFTLAEAKGRWPREGDPDQVSLKNIGPVSGRGGEGMLAGFANRQIERLERRLMRRRDDTETLEELMRLHLDRGDPRGRLIELELRLPQAGATQRQELLDEKERLQQEHLEHHIGPLTNMPDVEWELKWGYLWRVWLPRFSEEWCEPVRVILSHPTSRMFEGLCFASRRLVEGRHLRGARSSNR